MDLPNPGIESGSLALQAGSSPPVTKKAPVESLGHKKGEIHYQDVYLNKDKFISFGASDLQAMEE